MMYSIESMSPAQMIRDEALHRNYALKPHSKLNSSGKGGHALNSIKLVSRTSILFFD